MSATLKAQQMGGQIMAIRQRELAIKKYYKNPKICKYCNKIIEIHNNEIVSKVRRKSFCSFDCYKNYNKIKPKLNKSIDKLIRICPICNNKYEVDIVDRGTKYREDLRCSSCKNNNYHMYVLLLGEKSKKEIFDLCANWQSARTSIRKHAKLIFDLSTKAKECCVCGYKKHYEISHIKSVASFEGNILLKVINDPNNLVALCPRCHWEYDNNAMDEINLIKLKNTVKI